MSRWHVQKAAFVAYMNTNCTKAWPSGASENWNEELGTLIWIDLRIEHMTIMIPAWVNGVLTPIEKLAAHERGLKHKAVSVFVMNQGRVLIQQRAMHKYHTPGQWANTCCTHPEWDESDVDCAVRRLDDELGITGLYPSYKDTIEYRADVGNGLIEHEVVAVFVAEAEADLTIAPNPDEVMATRWIDVFDLTTEVQHHPEKFTPWLRIYLAKHMTEIFGDMPRGG